MKVIVSFAMLALSCAAHAQLHKCTLPSGKVEYSDAPCADARQATGMRGGTVSGVDAMSRKEIDRAMRSDPKPRAPQATVIGGQHRGPTDKDIRDLETSASSITKSKKEREFLRAEAQRARAAQESGSYTADDQRRLKEAQEAQNRIDPKDREAARRNAEDIHLYKGSPGVQAGVLQSRQAEEDAKNARRAAAAATAAAQQAAAPSGPTYCSGARCWAGGKELHPSGNGTYTGGDQVCRRTGNSLNCP
jgi:hypothetical protein